MMATTGYFTRPDSHYNLGFSYPPTGIAPSAARAAFSDFQVQRYSFSVDQYRPRVDELLASAVVFLVAAQLREREKEFHGFGFDGGGRSACQVHGRTETDPVKLCLFLEIG